MGDRLFHKSYRLTISLGSPVAGAWFQTLQEQIVITDMRVKFDIEKSMSKSPNRAKIEISNLREDTRQQIQTRRPLKVMLEAGWDDKVLVIFKGDAALVESTHERTDWITKLEAGDGELAFANASIAQSFGEGATGQQVLGALAKQMGLSVPTNVQGAKDLIKQITGGAGISLHGTAQTEMTKLLRPTGRSWSVQDEQLVILGAGETSESQAVLISQQTGMIGEPDYELPKTPGKPAVLKVKSQLNGNIQIGRKIQMNSDAIKGLFRVEKLKHSGDTHGKPWETEIQATML